MISWDDYWKKYKISKAERWLIRERDKILNTFIDKILSANKKVIEIGCGYGSNITLINETRSDVECYALDNSQASIDLVKERIPNSIIADCRETNFPDNTFDIVYSAGLMEHFEDEKPLLDEWKRILKPNGYMLTFIPAKYSLWQFYQLLHFGKWKHGYEKAYTHKKLLKLFEKNNFEIIEVLGIDPFSINGFFMKLFNISFKPFFKKSCSKSGYTELCIIVKKN
ncbi:MAG: class I SAM-dependent methyltransferase [Ignavibacteriales bacterium]|nr:class I SAM-dependent methyltransferase [Ignavibacteriales bacterium]